MKEQKRTMQFKIRLTPNERQNLEDFACAEGETLTNVIRYYCKYIFEGDWRKDYEDD